ncbi:MAG: FkbM family methyltransferase [Gemmataceae bacterium]
MVAFPATDGKLCPRPAWWTESAGAWGCMRSHLRIIERCLNAGYQSALVFEDDALFPENFVRDLQTFLLHLPADWQMIYLGGQLLRDGYRPPTKVNDWVYRPYNVNRLHAYAIRGTAMLRTLYEHLTSQDWFSWHHIDHHFGRLHQTGKYGVYVPKRWLVGQLEDQSDITSQPSSTNFWEHAEDVARRGPQALTVVLGLHESGSERIALALERLGVHMGDELGDAIAMQDAQDPRLTTLCEQAAPFPAAQIAMREDHLLDRLGDWLGHHMWRARLQNKQAGAKHPLLCLLTPYLKDFCGDRLKAIDVRTSLDNAVAATSTKLNQGNPAQGTSVAQSLQDWLLHAKEKFLATVPHLSLGREYWEQNPAQAVERIVEFLGLHRTEEQKAHAVAALSGTHREMVPTPVSATKGSKETSQGDPLFKLLSPARQTVVVDVGANPIDGMPPYKGMLDKGLCRVVGFDPQPSAMALLQSRNGDRETYLPFAVGDGSEQMLNICAVPGMTSVLKPDQRTLSLFPRFSEFGRVVGAEKIQTRSLDAISEIPAIDFLKIDVQGGELGIFRAGRKKLAEAVVIQTEVAFVPLYQNQPPLGQLDMELREQGFIPHALVELKRWVIAPAGGDDARLNSNQLLEADLVYVRDFRNPAAMSDEQLKHLALIAHHCYRSFDLALHCLLELETRGLVPTPIRQIYLEEVVARSN